MQTNIFSEVISYTKISEKGLSCFDTTKIFNTILKIFLRSSAPLNESQLVRPTQQKDISAVKGGTRRKKTAVYHEHVFAFNGLKDPFVITWPTRRSNNLQI